MKPVVFDHDSWTIYRWTTSVFASNVYLVIPQKGEEAMLIDAGGKAKDVIRTLKELGKQLKWIVLTHKHFDHAALADTIRRATGARIVMGKGDAGKSKPIEAGGKALEDGDIIKTGTLSAKVIATPGHTQGGISLSLPGTVFTGDTLFAGGIGRADLRGGDERALMKSIREKLLALSDDTVVYPGHGPPSTIKVERKTNPFLLGEW